MEVFFDHHQRDRWRIGFLDSPQRVTVTRRWYYMIPAEEIRRFRQYIAYALASHRAWLSVLGAVNIQVTTRRPPR